MEPEPRRIPRRRWYPPEPFRESEAIALVREELEGEVRRGDGLPCQVEGVKEMGEHHGLWIPDSGFQVSEFGFLPARPDQGAAGVRESWTSDVELFARCRSGGRVRFSRGATLPAS